MGWRKQPGDVREEFLEIFSRTLTADGDIFVADSDRNRREAELAAKSKDIPEFEFEGPPLLTDLFSKGKLEHLMKHQRFMEKRPPSLASRAYIADISQNPDARNRSSFLVPTVTRSSCFVSMSKGCILTPALIDASLGWPGLRVGQDNGDDVRQYWQYVGVDRRNISDAEHRSLAGNGMHLAAAGAWELFAASSVVRRDALQNSVPPSHLAAAALVVPHTP